MSPRHASSPIDTGLNCGAVFHALCELSLSVLEGSNSLVCVQLRPAPEAANIVPIPQTMCEAVKRWQRNVKLNLRLRAETMRRFITVAAASINATGVLLVETHDVPTLHPAAVDHVGRLGVPVVATSARSGTFERIDLSISRWTRGGHLASTAPRKARALHVLLPDFTFLKTRGHRKLRDTLAQLDRPWSKKARRVVFRGQCSGIRDCANTSLNARVNLSLHASSVCPPSHCTTWDVGITCSFCDRRNWPAVSKVMADRSIIKPRLNRSDALANRGLFDVDGNANAWEGFYWKLLSQSVVLKVEGFEQWYYDEIKPWSHYVPVHKDLAGVDAAVSYVLDPAHDDELQRIAARANKYMQAPNSSVQYEVMVSRMRVWLTAMVAAQRSVQRRNGVGGDVAEGWSAPFHSLRRPRVRRQRPARQAPAVTHPRGGKGERRPPRRLAKRRLKKKQTRIWFHTPAEATIIFHQ